MRCFIVVQYLDFVLFKELSAKSPVNYEQFDQLPRSSDTSPLFIPVKISTPMYRCIITMKHSTPPNVRQHASCTHCLVIIPKFSNFLLKINESFLSKQTVLQ